MAKKKSPSKSNPVNDFRTQCGACGKWHGLTWGAYAEWNTPCPMSSPKENEFSGLSIVELPYILIARHSEMFGMELLAHKYARVLQKPLLVIALNGDIRPAALNADIDRIGGFDLIRSYESLKMADAFMVMRKSRVTPTMDWALIKDNQMMHDAMWAYRLFQPKKDEGEAA